MLERLYFCLSGRLELQLLGFLLVLSSLDVRLLKCVLECCVLKKKKCLVMGQLHWRFFYIIKESMPIIFDAKLPDK